MGSLVICGIVGAIAFVACAIASHDKGVDEGMACGMSYTIDALLRDVALGNIRLVGDYVEFSEDSSLVPYSMEEGRTERIPVDEIIDGLFENAPWED